MRYHPKATSSTSKYGSPKQSTEDNNVVSVQVRSQVTPQVSPLAQVNTLAQPTHTNSFPPPPYFPIPSPPPVPPSNASIAPSAPASDLSAAISLMTNAVNQGNANTANITDALQKTTTQFAEAYKHYVRSYREALVPVWNLARFANIDTVLKTVTDKKMQEIKTMAERLKTTPPRPKAISDKTSIPDLKTVTSTMLQKFPGEKLPMASTCEKNWECLRITIHHSYGLFGSCTRVSTTCHPPNT